MQSRVQQNIPWEAAIGKNMMVRSRWPRKFRGQDSEDPGFRQDLHELTTEAGGNGDPGWADDETQALEPQPPPLNAMLVLPSLGPFWREKGGGQNLR